MSGLQAEPQKPVRHILTLTGGMDSTALAIHLRKTRPHIDMEYVFCDTHKELPETYDYLLRLEAFLAKKIIRLNTMTGFDHWLAVFGGYLPSPRRRWCTRLLKLKPFEEFVGAGPVINYVAIRADEDRIGYISLKENITPVFPLKEDRIDYAGVIRILQESGLGLPPYLAWGRSHSGCFFCFFQKRIEWVRLLECHPDLFEAAMQYEKVSDQSGKMFTWNRDMPLSELKRPENVEAIKRRYEQQQQRLQIKRPDRALLKTLAGLEAGDGAPQGCLICNL